MEFTSFVDASNKMPNIKGYSIEFLTRHENGSQYLLTAEEDPDRHDEMRVHLVGPIATEPNDTREFTPDKVRSIKRINYDEYMVLSI